MVCEKCGKDLLVGEWPFCPHGIGYSNVIGDDIPGGETVENMGHEPVTYYSKSERKRLMAAHGVEEFVRHQPTKGSDKSPITTDWSKGSMDPQTLENARILSERQGGSAKDPNPGPPKSFRWTVEDYTP